MSDEQMIYISPEDDLTAVRERLERLADVPARHVTLVIPTHTQLRSHVAWKLLYSRARDLGKEVLIVSSDPQVRSVAHAAKFKVAHSLESSSSSKSRPTTRPGRSNTGTKGGRTTPPPPRTQPGRGPGESRGGGNIPARPSGQFKPWFSSTSEQPSVPPESESQRSRADEMNTGGLSHPASSTFEFPEQPFGQNYDFSFDTSPPIRPLSQQQIDEEPDLLLEDFNQAQDIRHAAFKGVDPDAPQKPDQSHPPLPPRAAEDPFPPLEAALPPTASEQRGFVSLQGSGMQEHIVQDVADFPTEILGDQIEYQERGASFGEVPAAGPLKGGDPTNWEAGSRRGGDPIAFPGGHSWPEPTPEDEQDIVGPSRPQNVRPHSSRTGRPTQTPRLPADFTDDALPPPIVEQPAPQEPPSTPTKRPSDPLTLPPSGPRPVPQTPSPQSRPAGYRPATRSGQRRQLAPAPAARMDVATRRRGQMQQTQPRARRSFALLIAVIFLLIVLGALAFFGPSADVTLTLQSHTFSHAISLTAHVKGQQGAAVVTGSVPAELQTKVFSKSGSGIASGTAKIGTAPATGIVTFTNTSTTHVVVVPTNTVVATSGGTKFGTDAEASLNIAGTNHVGTTVQVPVHAILAGDSGNVPANSITIIPPDSMTALANTNHLTTADLKVQVTNDSPTTGGGVGSAPVVAAKDLDAAKVALQQQLQSSADSWVHQLGALGVVGTPTTAVALVNGPKEGQVLTTTTFPVTVNMTVSALVVHTVDLQAATKTQLNMIMATDKAYAKAYPNDAVSVDAKHPIAMSGMKTSSAADATSMTLDFTANVLAVSKVVPETIQNAIAGKSSGDASAYLASLPGVQHVDIKRFPGFFPLLPFWSGRINVILVPGA